MLGACLPPSIDTSQIPINCDQILKCLFSSHITGVTEGSDGHDMVMIHVDVNDLANKMQSSEASTSGDRDGVELRYDASLAGLEWLDSIVKAIMQAPGCLRDRLLISLVLSAQGRDLTGGVNGLGPESHHLTRDGLREIQKAADAAGIFVPREASAVAMSGSSAAKRRLEAMMPGGGREDSSSIDPGAFVVTPMSAMMAMAASSGEVKQPHRLFTLFISCAQVMPRPPFVRIIYCLWRCGRGTLPLSNKACAELAD